MISGVTRFLVFICFLGTVGLGATVPLLAADAPGVAAPGASALPEPEMPAMASPQKPSSAMLADPGAWIEKTGVVRKERSKRRFRKWMGDTLLVLRVSEREEYTLLRGRNKLVVQAVEEQVGQMVSVTGPVIPGNERHLRPGLKVMHFIPVTNSGEDAASLASSVPDLAARTKGK